MVIARASIPEKESGKEGKKTKGRGAKTGSARGRPIPTRPSDLEIV